MIEPTESESLSEINRFCETLIKIKEEIDKVTDLVKESLQENSVSNNVKIDLHIDKVVPKGMFVADEMLRILIEIDGHTIVKYGE